MADKKAEAWAKKNPWFGKDQEMTNVAFKIHDDLVNKEKIEASSDKYYNELDKRIKKLFPLTKDKEEALGSLKIFLYEDNRADTFLEEFYIKKFEDLEKKIYGYGKDLKICIRKNSLEKSSEITLFQFDAQENSPNGNFNSPNDPGRYWAFLQDDNLHDFLADFEFIKLYPDDLDKEIEFEQKFIKKKKLDHEDRRDCAKNFIDLFL